MSDNEYDKETVNLWVEPEQKERWEAYLEAESDLQHMSQLVRRSVEQTINRNEPSEVSIPDTLEAQLVDVVNTVEQFGNQIEQLDARLVSIEQAVRDNPNIRDLANRVFEVLPSKAELTEYEQLVSETGSNPPESVESAVHGGRVADIAGALEEPEQRVRQALQKLQQDTHRVHTTEIGDDRRYYKEA